MFHDSAYTPSFCVIRISLVKRTMEAGKVSNGNRENFSPAGSTARKCASRPLPEQARGATARPVVEALGSDRAARVQQRHSRQAQAAHSQLIADRLQRGLQVGDPEYAADPPLRQRTGSHQQMPRPVAIEPRHHLAQRLLVEDQQAAPPTGQVVEATAQRRLDAALRAVAQALALAQLAAPDGPRARMRQGHRDAVFEHPDLDAAVLVAADQEPSTQRASAAAGAFHHEGPCLPPRAGRRGRSRCLRAGAPVARGCRRRHRWHSVRPARPRCHPPAAGCVPRPCR